MFELKLLWNLQEIAVVWMFETSEQVVITPNGAQGVHQSEECLVSLKVSAQSNI